MIEQLALLRILALGRALLGARYNGGAWGEMRWAAFDQDVGVLMMAHRDGIGVRVVEFLMGSWTGVGRSGYLESTGELVRVSVLGVVRGGRSWYGCRVWSPGGNGCGGKVGGDGALGPIPRPRRARNGIEVSETGKVDNGEMHIRGQKMWKGRTQQFCADEQ